MLCYLVSSVTGLDIRSCCVLIGWLVIDMRYNYCASMHITIFRSPQDKTEACDKMESRGILSVIGLLTVMLAGKLNKLVIKLLLDYSFL